MDNKETYTRDNILDALRVVLPWLFQEVYWRPLY